KGIVGPTVEVGLRTGDSTAHERAALVKSPPDLIVTTPESLYLLCTSAKGRSALQNVSTIIIDEIHTLARDKRGAHLAVTVERLAALVAKQGRRLQRIGLSATQRPLSVVGELLSGVGEDREPPVIIDCGHRRNLEVSVALGTQDLEAVASAAQMTEALDDLAEQVRQHHTTLIFVNTRRMAERLAHQLAERLGEDPSSTDDDHLRVAAHHGSLSFARRRLVEARLRSGDLKALVATASLELGIDVGPVDLVCQFGSPRAIATFLQRIGRANHHVGGTPQGRIYAMTRDELVECTALLAAVRAGDLDVLHPVRQPMDVAIQQIVAEVGAAEECTVTELYDLLRHTAAFSTLSVDDFDEALELAARGIVTGRGRRGAHLHLDRVNGLVRPAKSARLTALLNGGVIPETGDYRVVLDPEGVTIGQVNEDFAIDSTPGDVFLLGTQSWRVTKVETSVVRVVDAGGARPSVPFWLGEAPARTTELSHWVGTIRALAQSYLEQGRAADLPAAIDDLSGVGEFGALQVATYLAAAYGALGQLPTAKHLVVERFFDEAEGSQLIVHSPHGGRINRALALALRQRFCVTFDFELQAAADDDTVLISLGPHHSFPLAQVPNMVRSDQAISVLTQAVLPHPMLQARWRWNLNRSLIVSRTTSGGRRPIHLQRMESEDLLAATWPSLAACQENAAPGPIPIPDHLLVRQTIADTLFEPMDGEGLVELLAGIERGEITCSFVESATPSPLSHGILTGRPYTFLDDAPLEERRSRAVGMERSLPELANVAAGGSTTIDPQALEQLLEQLQPKVRSADELCDLLEDLVAMRPVPEWQAFATELLSAGRMVDLDGLWVAQHRAMEVTGIHDDDELPLSAFAVTWSE
ncbi:MAG: helicase-related protein, partial [Actinomycetes bacterium]